MSKWLPTNKWVVATVAAAGTAAVMFWTGDGVNTDSEKVVLITLIVGRIAAYWARNEPDVLQVAAETVVEHNGEPLVRDSRGRWTKKAVIAGEPGVTEVQSKP